MKKSDFWRNIWIPVKKRLPPEDPEKEILIWNYSWKKPMIMRSDLALYSAKDFLKDEKLELGVPKTSKDRLFSHWCFIHPPSKRRRTK